MATAATRVKDAFRSPWLFSLRGRLLLLVFLSFGPAFAILFYTSFAQRQHAVARVRDAALDLVRVAAHEQQQLIAGARQLLISLAQFPAIRAARPSRHCDELLSSLLREQPYYANLGAARPDGTVFCSGLNLPPGSVNIADRLYFRQALESRDFAFGKFQIGRITGKRSLNIGYPVRHGRESVIAVVFAAVDLSWLNQLLAQVKMPEGAVLTVTDDNGTILARHPDPQPWLGKTMPEWPALRGLLAGRGEGVGEIRGSDGRERIYALTRLNWTAHGSAYISLGIPKDRALAEVEAAFARSLAVLALIALLVFALAVVSGELLVLRRLRALADAAGRFARGELGARTGLPPTRDEIGRLAEVFDTMAETLQKREGELEQAREELTRVNRALATLSAGNMALVRATDEPALLREMCRVAVEVGGYPVAWAGYAESPAGHHIRIMAQAPDEGSGPAYPRLEILAAEAIQSGKPVVVRDIASNERYPALRRLAHVLPFASCVALPFGLDGQRGALFIGAAEPDAFGEEEMRRLAEMAEDLSFGLRALRTRARQREADEALRHLAYHDTLTGLANQAQLAERLRACLAEAHRQAPRFALLVLDIHRLGEINDALGFHQGDALLREIGPRLQLALGRSALIARLRGDEFGALLGDCDAECARRAAQRILEALRAPFLLGDLPVYVDVGIGVALCPEHGGDADELIKRADVAMRQAKKSGQGYFIYDRTLDRDSAERLALASDLRQAIERGELELYYQPKVELRTRRLAGVEALARWKHAQRGIVPPDAFIALAEHTGLIQPLTDWVLETALRQSYDWQRIGVQVPIAVNVSLRNLRDPGLPDRIRGLCSTWGVRHDALEMEITESAIMEEAGEMLPRLQRLREQHVRLYIDDFGTGYSSLSHLKRLPVDAVKIDKSFVSDLPDNKDSALIVRSTIDLAHDLGLKVVAEGVESEATCELLARLGCDVAQGYHLGRPAPAASLKEWLSRYPLASP